MKKKLFLNTLFPLIQQIVALICGFILPRLILGKYGSECNGIVTSVTQFLSVITLLRGGVGGVTRAALYKPLLENDEDKISGILNSTERFMRKISFIFLGALFIFALVYPFFVINSFSWFYAFSMVLILGISTFSQYFFGITYQMLLQADQKNYIYSIFQTVATVANIVFCIFLINLGVEFRLVKLVTSLVFASIPLGLYWYVHKKYRLNKKITPDNSALGQRWDAFSHQVAAFVNSNTDVMVLTVFSNLFQVSIYSVYYMVIAGIGQFVTLGSSGIEAAIGKVSATDDLEKLKTAISLYELIINFFSSLVFTCAMVLIVPFVKIYTAGVTDANYIQPVFGLLLCVAAFIQCVRLPYQNLVDVNGRFKDTKIGAMLEAAINIAISIPLVICLGCIGVVIGTIVANSFRTIDLAVYSYKHLLKENIICFIKRMTISVLSITAVLIPLYAFGIDHYLFETVSSYRDWFLVAVISFSIVFAVVLAINAIFYFKELKQFLRVIFKRT